MTNIRRIAIATAGIAIVLVGVAAPEALAVTSSVTYSCPDNTFCVYGETGGQGHKCQVLVSNANISSLSTCTWVASENAKSVYNNSGRPATYYTSTNDQDKIGSTRTVAVVAAPGVAHSSAPTARGADPSGRRVSRPAACPPCATLPLMYAPLNHLACWWPADWRPASRAYIRHPAKAARKGGLPRGRTGPPVHRPPAAPRPRTAATAPREGTPCRTPPPRPRRPAGPAAHPRPPAVRPAAPPYSRAPARHRRGADRAPEPSRDPRRHRAPRRSPGSRGAGRARGDPVPPDHRTRLRGRRRRHAAARAAPGGAPHRRRADAARRAARPTGGRQRRRLRRRPTTRTRDGRRVVRTRSARARAPTSSSGATYRGRIPGFSRADALARSATCCAGNRAPTGRSSSTPARGPCSWARAPRHTYSGRRHRRDEPHQRHLPLPAAGAGRGRAAGSWPTPRRARSCPWWSTRN